MEGGGEVDVRRGEGVCEEERVCEKGGGRRRDTLIYFQILTIPTTIME